MAALVVNRRAVESIRHGHPWLYAQAIDHAPSVKAQSAAVRLVTADGEVLGCGIHDPGSPIAVRVWTLDRNTFVGPDLFSKRVRRALAVRASLFADGRTTAYRLLNGEGDRTPGFVIDRYADVAVLRLDGDAARALAPMLTRDLEAILREAGITTLLDRETIRGGGGNTVTVVFGSERTKVEVSEHGVPFVVDVMKGQKTGAFLDQRENRRRVGDIVRRRAKAGLGTRLLNLFSYTGGFSLHAALAGASVTSVDVAAHAHATAQESFKLAGVDPKKHSFASADCFAFLEKALKNGQTWDIVISDPPSFAPNEKSKPRALVSYRNLHHACARVLADQGTFVAASCSSHVSAEDFMTTLDDASLARDDLRLLELHGAPPDHPSLPVFPEGRYLKLAVLE